ncbi:NADPH-dependent assimilatory sulfite reductase hemoprotein subunit [Thalassoglobus polymorphus]|uniref:Sulfite reductase [ferredoxin] n=1 Tax=Thalassoglobus polymorphus TaxID=2527994 RepID=A0A517QQI5_9PLAN|nr:NADPH-dependent assimilatory sulfite reductase hemoprotein subunit [Thalassoglobus polymorphus]QDT33894.1 Sulfite reductase [ferredoxin] [Thalassoglobus polymorphus]
MADKKLSKVEGIKGDSQYLRGSIKEDLLSDAPQVSSDNFQLLKFHGTYQQDNRDERKGGSKSYSFMVRSRIPGGKVTAAQFLAELDLCDKYGNETLRITDRQGFQIHGVVKGDLKSTIRGINESKLSTLSACGDVCRNFMCCPAPHHNSPIHDEMQALAKKLAMHFAPKSTAYSETWLTDEDGEKTKVAEVNFVEPIYGKTYLPRKFKFGIALPEDNCVDIYTQDLGLMTIVEDGKIIGYNILVGGGQGMTPAKKETFPAVGKRMAFATTEQIVEVCEAIVKVQRDFGDRVDRKFARMKYLIHNWGLEKFKAKVEEYYGASLPEPHPTDVTDVDDHMGWHEQGDGKLFLGINVENGRIKDEGDFRLKTAIRVLLNKYGMDARLTALQGMILCDIDPADKADIESILKEHGIALADDLSLSRRYSISCPALPTCGLAVTESERIMPSVMDDFDGLLKEHGLSEERVTVHMTGCPNGCARPYTPDVGLVGKARGKYTIYLGGNAQGLRIGFIYADMVPQEEIVSTLSPVFARYKSERNEDEAFGDYCHRIGLEALTAE